MALRHPALAIVSEQTTESMMQSWSTPDGESHWMPPAPNTTRPSKANGSPLTGPCRFDNHIIQEECPSCFCLDFSTSSGLTACIDISRCRVMESSSSVSPSLFKRQSCALAMLVCRLPCLGFFVVLLNKVIFFHKPNGGKTYIHAGFEL